MEVVFVVILAILMGVVSGVGCYLIRRQKKLANEIKDLYGKVGDLWDRVDEMRNLRRELSTVKTIATKFVERGERIDQIVALRMQLVKGGFTPEESYGVISMMVENREL